MAGESQESFFARVRDALSGPGQPADLPEDLENTRVISSEQNVVEVFAGRVEEAGMHAHRVADEPAMLDRIMEIIDSVGGKSAIVPVDELPARDKIISRLTDRSIDLLSPDEADASFAADVGITGAASAVAETASLCVHSGGAHRPLASLAVPCHIAIIRAAQIVPDLLDWAAHAPMDRPADEVLISGPSKTADIEMILVQGVHGPGEVHVIIVG